MPRKDKPARHDQTEVSRVLSELQAYCDRAHVEAGQTGIVPTPLLSHRLDRAAARLSAIARAARH